MGPRSPTRRQIIDWLGAAAEHAEHAEIYHAAAINPQALDDALARQAARDAAAMQLIELAGCAEGFTRDRGEPGTTLARLDDVLRPLFKTRAAHVHPEIGITPPAPVTSTNLSVLMGHLKAAVRNLDLETWKIQAQDQQQALQSIYDGLTRIEKDGLPDPAALRPRDLHYAAYYHEIQFGRLAKATGLYENWKSPDPRHVDVNRSIFDADDMAHKFHAMRAGPDKSRLPVSVVAPEHRGRVPGRSLSELLRELRHEYQRPEERLEELAKLSAARAREEYRDSVRDLSQQYVRMTGDADAAGAIHDYVQRQKPALDREMIDAMRHALQTAVDPGGDYLELPEAVRNRCLDLCLALDSQDDGRLLDILDAADGRGRSRGKETEALIHGMSGDTPMNEHLEPLMLETTQGTSAQDRESAVEPGQSVKAKLAEMILAQENDHSLYSHYDIAPWQGGFAVFRIYKIEDPAFELQDLLPTGQQVLGHADTLDQLHDAIIDGSAFTAASAWITDQQMNKAQNSQPLTCDDVAQRVQRILDDPTREADERDPAVLQALEERRAAGIEATQATSSAAEDELLNPTDGGDKQQDRHHAGSAAEPVEDIASSQEQTDDAQVRYDKETGERIEDGGRDVTGRSPGGGRGQSY